MVDHDRRGVMPFESPLFLLVNPFVGHDDVEAIFIVGTFLVENADPVFVVGSFLGLGLNLFLSLRRLLCRFTLGLGHGHISFGGDLFDVVAGDFFHGLETAF